MAREMNIRRWDEREKGYVEVQERWPVAAIDKARDQWCLEGHGWRLVFDGAVPADDARRICEAIAGKIQVQL